VTCRDIVNWKQQDMHDTAAWLYQVRNLLAGMLWGNCCNGKFDRHVGELTSCPYGSYVVAADVLF